MLRNGFGRAFLALIAATLALFLPAESRAACPGTKTCTGCKAAFCDGDVWTCDGFQPQGTACTDNNLCTAGDTCDGAGHCIAGPAVTCTAQDQCHVAGTCNPATGSCSNPIKANGSACNDGNACTGGETCQNGACNSPTSNVQCSPIDSCHAAGACTPTTGACGTGAPTCMPSTPSSIAGPTATNTTGAFTISWAASALATSYNLYENGLGVYSVAAPTTGIDVAGKTDGWYYYEVAACNSVGCAPKTSKFSVKVLRPGTCNGMSKPTTLSRCQQTFTCLSGEWIDTYYDAGTTCDDNDACTTGETCSASHVCGNGTLTCVPGTPGPISGPATSPTSSYTISWTAGSGVVSSYELYQDGALAASTPAAQLSVAISGQQDGTHVYKVRAINSVGPSPFTANFTVNVILPPGTPSLSVPRDSGSSYQVSWTPTSGPGLGHVDRYDLGEQVNGGAWTTTSETGTSKSYTGKAVGTYGYQVRACNATACSNYATGTMQVITQLVSSVDDAPLAPPSQPIPTQGFAGAGALPGSPSVEGGAAAYEIPIQVPPGRAGMQPSLALTYSSRNGNGVVGVGWGISGTSTIYRCPRTLAQDGGNRVVRRDSIGATDRLCFAGSRLMTSPDSRYGFSGTEYRTETDQFSRIFLQNHMSSSESYFTVEQKNGHKAIYEPWTSFSQADFPSTWYLTREYDRQGNCIRYDYNADEEHALASVTYTGMMNSSGDQCVTTPDSRSVVFDYTTRDDGRTTYSFGAVSSIMTLRLASIVTRVGSKNVRRYQLDYSTSVATRRSLLHTVTVCAAGTSTTTPCGLESLPQTTFTYQQDAPQFVRERVIGPAGPLGPDWQMQLGADFDGDGLRDRFYIQQFPNTISNRYLWLSRCPSSYFNLTDRNAFPWLPYYAHPADGTPLGGTADFNEDGKVDIIGVWGGKFAFATADCAQPDVILRPTPTDLVMSALDDDPTVAPTPIDLDGDGILDLKYGDIGFASSGGSVGAIYRHRVKEPTKWDGNYDTITVPTITGMAANVERDINGDGYVDTVYDWAPLAKSGPGTKISFFMGVDANPQFAAIDLSALSPEDAQGNSTGPQSSFSNPDHNQRRWIDVNGDGLPDIYEPGVVWVNHGGPPVLSNGAPNPNMFIPVPVSLERNVSIPPNRLQYSFAMDVDADGIEELMVPALHRTISYCGGDPNSFTRNPPDNTRDIYCGSAFDDPTTNERWLSFDHSVFTWDAYKFTQSADGSFVMVKVPTNLEGPINGGIEVDDFEGRGMSSTFFKLKNGSDGWNKYQDVLDADLGTWKSRNTSSAPDLLVSASNGLLAVAQWQHQPLSQLTVAGCEMPQGEQFYVAAHDDVHSPGYVFFTSSMWTVSKFEVSNGLGAATNKTCYRYKNAMLNNEGRGFQGFKTIVAEEQFPVAAGEDATLGVAGCILPGQNSGTCSPNNLRTTSNFNQEFPFTSKLDTVTVENVRGSAATLLGRTTYWWNAAPSTFGSTVVFPVGVLEEKFDPGGPPGAVVQTITTVSEFDLASGEMTRSCATSVGPTPSATRDIIKCETRVLPVDATAAWRGQIQSRTLASDLYAAPTTGGPLSPTCHLSGTAPANTWVWPTNASACSGTAAPAAPGVGASAIAQTTNFTWNGDAALAGSIGRLQSEAFRFNNADEAKTTYAYDLYGNVQTRTVNARDTSVGSTYPPATGTPSPNLQTSYQMTSDGYFVATETNPKGHVLTSVSDPATGLVTAHQAIQGGPVARMAADSLGRVTTEVMTDATRPLTEIVSSCDGRSDCIAPAVQHRVTACDSASVAAKGDCAIKRQAFQSGAPIKTEYVDMLGRVIAQGVENFDGKEVVTRVDYNARGAKVREHQPVSTGLGPGAWDAVLASAYMTQYSQIDALGRVGTKTVIRTSATNFFEPGRGSANLVTTYKYVHVDAGLQTKINVFTPTAAAGQITMSRTYDPRGKLVQTTQDVSSPTSHSIMTSYSYDAAGDLVAITDSGNNQLVAEYDSLGRKTKVKDPDRGIWSYTWDGLGRVRTQLDAKGTTLAYQYDVIGRMERRFMLPPAPATQAWLLEANWQYDLNNKPGTLGAMLGVADTTLGSLTDTTKDWFHRDYQYDSVLRPWSIATHIPAGSDGGVSWTAQDLIVEYAYDRNYARMKAMSSPKPNPEFVRLDYDARGNALGETPLGADGKVPAGASPFRLVKSMSLRGQVAEQDFANGVVETTDFDDSTGQPLWISATGLHEPSTVCPTAATPLVRQLTYKYDHFLNLASQEKDLYKRDSNGALSFNTCAPVTVAATEKYSYDELQRLTQTTRSWTNLTPDATAATPTQYGYSDLGNFTSKSDYAQSYTYPSSGANTFQAPGPHAVTALSNGMSFGYDKNGNLTSSTGIDARGVTFDNLDRPIKITKGTVNTVFRYAPDGARYLQLTSGVPNSPYPKTVYYVDKLFEKVVWNAVTEEKTYLGASTVIVRNGTTRDVRYMNLDRLGSVEAVTTATGAEYVPDQHSFDAFGKPRKGDFTTGTDQLHSNDYNVTTQHGFTGHEHLDETYLIHMNGRVYDYQLGRFLSVDPIISNPANSQSINPYSYIGNNPLSGVDPTGYKTEEIGGPGTGCAEFSRCDVTFYNLPKSGYTRIEVVDNGKLVSSGLYPNGSGRPLSDTLRPATAQADQRGSPNGSRDGASPTDAQEGNPGQPDGGTSTKPTKSDEKHWYDGWLVPDRSKYKGLAENAQARDKAAVDRILPWFDEKHPFEVGFKLGYDAQTGSYRAGNDVTDQKPHTVDLSRARVPTGTAEAADAHLHPSDTDKQSPTYPFSRTDLVEARDNRALNGYQVNGLPYVSYIGRMSDRTIWVFNPGSMARPIYQIYPLNDAPYAPKN